MLFSDPRSTLLLQLRAVGGTVPESDQLRITLTLCHCLKLGISLSRAIDGYIGFGIEPHRPVVHVGRTYAQNRVVDIAGWSGQAFLRSTERIKVANVESTVRLAPAWSARKRGAHGMRISIGWQV